MAGATTTAISNALRTSYLPKLREQLQMKVRSWDLVPKTSDGVVGSSIILHLQTGYNEGVAAIAEGGALPTAGVSTYAQATIPVREVAGRGMVTTRVIEASRSNKGAVVRALSSEMKGLMSNVEHDLNRQFCGDGSGLLCLVDDTSPDTTLGVDAPYGVADNTEGGRALRTGMRLNIFSAKTGGTQRSGTALISGIAASTTVVLTIDALPTGTANNDFVFRAGSRGQEITGFLGAIDNTNANSTFATTYLSINRSTSGNEYWNANLIEGATPGTNEAQTEAKMQQALDLADINGAGNITHIMCDHAQLRAYEALLVADRQLVPKAELKLLGGRDTKTVPAFSGVPILVEKHAAPHIMQFIDMTSFKFYTYDTAGPSWMDMDGDVLSRVAGYPAYEFVLELFGDLACDRPNSNTTLRDLT